MVCASSLALDRLEVQNRQRKSAIAGDQVGDDETIEPSCSVAVEAGHAEEEVTGVGERSSLLTRRCGVRSTPNANPEGRAKGLGVLRTLRPSSRPGSARTPRPRRSPRPKPSPAECFNLISSRSKEKRRSKGGALRQIAPEARRPVQGVASRPAARCFAAHWGAAGFPERDRAGDGATPLARMRLLSGYVRKGRFAFAVVAAAEHHFADAGLVRGA